MISMCNYGIKRNWMKIKRKSLIENLKLLIFEREKTFLIDST